MRFFRREKPQAEPLETSPALPADLVAQRTARLTELCRELDSDDRPKRAYAVHTLLALLWIARDSDRTQIAFSLFEQTKTSDKVNRSDATDRFCRCLTKDAAEFRPPPNADELTAWAANALKAALNETLNRLNAASQPNSRPAEGERARETETCLDLLQCARRMASPDCLDACFRLLKMSSEDGGMGNAAPLQANPLREAAARTIADLPPDSLIPLWNRLGGADSHRIRDCLPVLNYFTDDRAIPRLITVLESRKPETDSESVDLAILRTFGRIGSRKALPALKRIVSEGVEQEANGESERTREARRIIQTIESGKSGHDRSELLRPAANSNDALLRPAASFKSAELLRPAETVENTENRKQKTE